MISKIIIWVYILFCIWAVGSIISLANACKEILIEKYGPDIRLQSSIKGQLGITIRTILLCLCPIVHLITLYIFVFQWEKLMNLTLKRCEEVLCKKDYLN